MNLPDKNSATDSYGSKRSVKGLFRIQPSVTMNLESIYESPITIMSSEDTYGMTKSAICFFNKVLRGYWNQKCVRLTILDPTATPRLRFSLSFTDTVTAVTCSTKHMSNEGRQVKDVSLIPAALPTIGSKMIPTNSLLI